MARQLLSKYHEKRDFAITAEPRGKASKSAGQLRFVVQLHEARRKHYDFRLEWNGVMKSWAVTRGPSYDPADKRLAVRTEDHPIEYNQFEGVIPPQQYGAGPVMIWDEGTWQPDGDPQKMEKKGHISFTIEGTRMQGHWHLVRMKTAEKRENWLLIKGDDEFSLGKARNVNFLARENTSAISGRTMAQIRKAGLGNTGKRQAAKKTAKKSRISLNALLKKYGKPELATLVDAPPEGEQWVHEIKYDGYRLAAFVVGGKTILRTRGMKDWTHKFGPLAKAFAELKVENAVFDLEACVREKSGRTNFGMLQEALSKDEPGRIEGWVFDLLYLNGEDYAKVPLVERKSVLASVFKNAPKKGKGPLHYSDHFESSPNLLAKACKLGAEGLVSKRKDSIYAGRRTHDWLKSKCGLEQEFVIGGFMPAKDNSKAVGALLLGYYKSRKLHYAGKVGTGFTRQSASDVYQKLIPLKTDQSPFPDKLSRGLREYVFVKPQKLCEVSFMEWTTDGHIRHGSFKGLREDKEPKSVKEEVPKKVKTMHAKTSAATSPKTSPAKGGKSAGKLVVDGVNITHPDREVFPGTGVTKGDVAQYYGEAAPLMFPFLEDRLISLLRCTDGIRGECFFQRNPMRGMGDHIKPKKVTHKGKQHEYLYVDDPRGIVQLAQMGTMEFHAWQSRISTKGKPDQVIFDLDPDDAVPFEAVKLAAEDVRARLKKLGLVSFPRLSGGKGIHVVVPIKPERGWDEIKEFTRDFAEAMASDTPVAYVANMSKARRKGKIFVDFFRNDFSATAIVPFSVRARDGAPIAWPLSWADLRKATQASDVRLIDLTSAQLKKAARVSAEFLKVKQALKI